MKITTNRQNFVQALSLGSSLSGKSKVLPVLDFTKLSFKNNKCRISSYDGEIAISTICKCDSDLEDKVFYVEPQILLKSLRSIKEEDVVLDFSEKELVINHRRGKFNIPLQDVAEFPTPVFDNDTQKITISSSILFNWIKESRTFVSTDSLRPTLCGFYLYIQDGELGICATDGFKLYSDNVAYQSDCNMDAIIPEKTANALLSMVNGTDKTEILFGENNIVFKNETTSLICRKITGKFPNFQAVIPNNHTVSADFRKEDFSDSLNRCLIMANTTSSSVKMELKREVCNLIAEDIDFSKKGEDFFDVSNCEMKEDSFTIGMRGSCVKQCLDSINSEDITIELTNPRTAIIFKDKSTPNKVILMMPLVID
jgi:DNA polymerase-3 subunit beta